MSQQRGVKRAAKVAARKKKTESRRKEANFLKLSRAHAESDNDHNQEHEENKK